MRKLLPIALLALIVACKKNNDAVQQPAYNGKWYVLQTVNMQYYIADGGDTVFYRNETSTYGDSADYIDFQINSGAKGTAVVNLTTTGRDSMSYEYLSHAYFKLDSTICEVTSLTDSSFRFNTLEYDAVTIPDKILVTQDFFILSK